MFLALFTEWSVLRYIHSFLQNDFSKQCALVFPLSNFLRDIQ